MLEIFALLLLLFLRKPEGELSLDIFFYCLFLFGDLIPLSYSLAVQKGLDSSFETPLCWFVLLSYLTFAYSVSSSFE